MQAYATVQSAQCRRNVMVFDNQQEKTAIVTMPQKENEKTKV